MNVFRQFRLPRHLRHLGHLRHLRHFRHTGRAAVEVGGTLHRVSHFLLTVSVIVSLGVIGAAWRLSRGPVDLGFLKDRVEQAIDIGVASSRATIGSASIAWAGFSHGLDQPLVLRLTDVTMVNAAGAEVFHVPAAEETVSIRWLLIGRLLPRTITLRGASLVLTRGKDGTVSFDASPREQSGAPAPGVDTTREPSPLRGLLDALGAPRETDLQEGGRQMSQLSAVSIDGATLRLDDQILGMTWSADRADIDLLRRAGGGLDGKATFVLALGGQKPVVTAAFSLAPAGRSAHVAAHLSRINPSAVAATIPLLGRLAGFDLPLTIDQEADLGPDLIPTHLTVTAHAGAGTIAVAGGTVPVEEAHLTVSGTPHEAILETAEAELRPPTGGLVTTIGASGTLTREDGRLTTALHLTLDHVAFNGLAALWPAGLSPPTRAWITKNIPSGRASDGKADLVLSASEDGTDLKLLSAAATLEGDDITVFWLPEVPPVEQAKAHLVLTDPDKVEIDVRTARQKIPGAEPLSVQNGHVTITGLSVKDQVATVQLDANGPIASAIALLKEPRVRVLDKHPMDLRGPAGDARVNLHVVVPLELKLDIDDVTIHGIGTLTGAHLTGVVAGRDLDDGRLSFDVDTSHLTMKGSAALGGIPANIDAMMDFRAGPPTQLLQRIAVSARPTAEMLAAAGLGTASLINGEVGLSLTLSEYRSGLGDVAASADLARSGLTVSPLAWTKPAGEAARAVARVTLMKDRLTGIDGIAIDGTGIQARGSVTVTDGRPDTIRIDRLILGGTDFGGTVRLARGDAPLAVELTGPALDAAAKLLEKPAKRDPAAPQPNGPPWSLRAHFDRVLLAHRETANQVTLAAESDGHVMRRLSLNGKIAGGKPFSVRIGAGQAAGSRHMTADLADAGSVLRGIGVTQDIVGGVMTVAGDYDDTTRAHTLSGTVEINDFRVSHAPALGKLLQAVTLYGLVDALSGPGLSFSRLVLPFQIDDDTLLVREARAVSPSLGLTVQGRIDRLEERLDLEGTLVPAYVFNSILGRLPVIGGLFTAEKGGGLFAMNYSLHGPIDDPSVSANPLSALTPGILRGMFGLIGQPAAHAAPLDGPKAEGNASPP